MQVVLAHGYRHYSSTAQERILTNTGDGDDLTADDGNALIGVIRWSGARMSAGDAG